MTLTNEVVGLDIGKHSVKAVWVSLNGSSPTVKRVEMLRLTSSSSDNKGLISQWLEKHGVTKRECVLGLSGKQCMFQPFRLAANDPRTPEQAAAMEVLNLSDLASEAMRHGFSSFKLNQDERRLLLCVVRPDIVNASLTTAQGLNLTLSDLVPTPVGLLKITEQKAEKDKGLCVCVNIGLSTTEVTVGKKGQPIFARTFGAAGQLFTETVADTTKVPMARAENAKINEGSLKDGPEKLRAALCSAADTWISEFRACMTVYENMFSEENTKPEQLILSGGGSLLKGLSEYLSEKLNMRVSLVTQPGEEKKIENFAAFAPAAGLAVAGLEKSHGHISLLPEEIKDFVLFRHNKPFWIFSAVTALLILGISVLGSYIHFVRKKEHLQDYNKRLENRQELGAQLDAVRKKNQQIQTMALPVKQLVTGAPLMKEIIAIVANNKAPGDWIGKISDARSYFAPYLFSAPEGKTDGPSTRTRRTGRNTEEAPSDGEHPRPDYSTETGFDSIIVEGYTPTLNFSTVKQLISRLRESPIVLSADLLGDDKLDMEGSVVRITGKPVAHRFVIEIKLSPQ